MTGLALTIDDSAVRLEQLLDYADEKHWKVVYCDLYAKLYRIYNHLLSDQNVLATAEELKRLMEELEP